MSSKKYKGKDSCSPCVGGGDDAELIVLTSSIHTWHRGFSTIDICITILVKWKNLERGLSVLPMDFWHPRKVKGRAIKRISARSGMSTAKLCVCSWQGSVRNAVVWIAVTRRGGVPVYQGKFVFCNCLEQWRSDEQRYLKKMFLACLLLLSHLSRTEWMSLKTCKITTLREFSKFLHFHGNREQ